MGRISPEEHRDLADGLCRFMAGGAEKFIAELTTDMKDAAANMDFERAAVLRDDIVALTKAFERNAVVLSDSTDADLFAFVQGRTGSGGAGVLRAWRAYPRSTRLDR